MSSKFCVLLIIFFAICGCSRNFIAPSRNVVSSIDCLALSQDKSQTEVISSGESTYVEYIENSPCYCSNPNFPIIKVSTNQPHNAWMQIVYTDSDLPALHIFLDSAPKDKYPEIYPFYTLEKDFIDAPLWQSNSSISYWKGHAWAVQVDRESRKIRPIIGIEWGFRFAGQNPAPKFIQPVGLDLSSWNQDWAKIKNQFTEFNLSE